ncbi:hypothetical protein LAZ67_8001550 [Cordylochernes scorpioides]|uniref:PiggyBac transposable element-derived protein domain-containing protein n=1 Tax=Cordylochernes scorpioides TaxID=51811 RepID=A0ABY6KTI8_9ARAC|nr:hypothetical protein LAZ67_8001550 [Cordylochernes scorpioides]
MNERRFVFLLNVLRFDNRESREERRKDDKLAPIRELCELFIAKCSSLYTPGTNCTIDESLLNFRGRCGFKQYIPNKPAKYGIKVFVLADSATYYFLTGKIYIGKDSNYDPNFSVPTNVVLELVKPIENTNRNITTDNWYTSYELAMELKKRNITLVGTLKKKKAIIPKNFLLNGDIGVSQYGFDAMGVTILSYVPKQKKRVILLSSMHHEKYTEKDSNKPEIIVYYNYTKGDCVVDCKIEDIPYSDHLPTTLTINLDPDSTHVNYPKQPNNKHTIYANSVCRKSLFFKMEILKRHRNLLRKRLTRILKTTEEFLSSTPPIPVEDIENNRKVIEETHKARINKMISEFLKVKNITNEFWSDATTGLAWIKRDDQLSTFVGNRVKEKCRLSDPGDWRYVPSECNPADIPSRGCNLYQLIESRRWNGPSWLKPPKNIGLPEAVMNGNPMTYVSDDPNDLVTISPSMFVQEQTDVEFPECQNMGPNPTTQKLRYLNKLRKELKSRFKKEYLSLLVQRNRRIYNPKL